MNVNLPLDDELAARIDEARGDLPRVRWIRQAINEKLAGFVLPLPAASTPPPTAADVVKGITTFAARQSQNPRPFRGPLPKPGAKA